MKVGLKIVQYPLSWVTYLVTGGVDHSMSFVESKKIRLTNICTILAGGCSFPYIFHFINVNWWLAVTTIIFVLVIFSVLLFNRWKNYRLARLQLIIGVNAYLFITASALGREAGEQMIYFPVIIGSVLVFAFQEKLLWWGSILMTLLCLVILELTDYRLFFTGISTTEQHSYYQGNLIITTFCTISLSLFSFSLYEKQYRQNLRLLLNRRNVEEIINYFSTSLFGQNTVDEVLWDVAKNCISRLGFTDCVIYLLNEERQVLVQKAAYGAKNPKDFIIHHPIAIPLGQGIVGSVALTGQAEIIKDTSLDKRYIADDEIRLSEITVPLVYQDQVIGVIDSEHPDKGFFTEEHLSILNTIASLCSNKIVRAKAEEEQRKTEAIQQEAERIKALDEAKSRFFTNISHEFRTPLTLIIGPLEEKLAENLSPKEMEVTERMHQQAYRLLRLINQLMDFSKLESQQLKLSLQPGNISLFLQPIINSFQPQAKQQSIDYQIYTSSEEILGYFDADKLEMMVYNLLSNAFKFTSAGGKIEVSISQEKERIVIEVQDSGTGIPADQLPYIFDRYYQADDSSVSSQGGTGIGLALTRELVSLHMGTISVESESGKGSLFKITLPIGKSELKALDELTEAPEVQISHEELVEVGMGDSEWFSLPKVLLVEDHQELRFYLKEQLKDDYQIHEAADGLEGWEAALETGPDLVVCDWMMPRVDGKTLCLKLKSDVRTSHIPIIMLTARADQASKLAGLETGADAYLIKPFNPQELRVRIRKLMEHRKQLWRDLRHKLIINPPEVTVNSTDERFLQNVIDTIEQELGNAKFTVEHLQEKMGISRMHLHRKLKAITAQSATEFIRTYRLKRAAQLLTQKADTVSQIAYQVGFSSLSYFTKSFKEQFGRSPSEYAG